jgi:hypothetical protein
LSFASPLLCRVARLVPIRSAGRCTRLGLTLRRTGPSGGRVPRGARRPPPHPLEIGWRVRQESEGRRATTSAHGAPPPRKVAAPPDVAYAASATWAPPAGSHRSEERGAKYGDADSDMWNPLCHVCENYPPKTIEGYKSDGFDSLWVMKT